MEEPKSKSQKKREADALQRMGVEFIALSLDKLALLPLSDQLRRAIIEAKALKSHGAIRRQAQLIGKLMRSSASDDVLAAYEDMQAEGRSQTTAFHDAEQWRERLLQGDKEALTEFVATYHPEDVQQLRLFIKKAMNEQKNNQNLGASKALFRYIRSCLV